MGEVFFDEGLEVVLSGGELGLEVGARFSETSKFVVTCMVIFVGWIVFSVVDRSCPFSRLCRVF